MKSAEGKIHIGTSGWMYKHWLGPFYPADLKKTGSPLDFYVKRFATVEINNSFYHLPLRSTFKHWEAAVPKHFVFAVKASRYISHIKRLNVPRASIAKFFNRVKYLKKKTGPILFQLPPHWQANPKRLERFLKILPRGYRYTFEFRDPSWFTEEIYGLLRKHKIAFCVYQLKGMTSPLLATAGFVYIRLHGFTEKAYQGDYSLEMLADWAGCIRKWSKEGRDVYVYFDNDQFGYAPKNAAELEEKLGIKRA